MPTFERQQQARSDPHRQVPTLLPALARLAAFVYYRVRYDGPPVAARGPVLLVANHPNSLLDPLLVMAAAGRSVRFLAKAPLFDDPKTAWLMALGRAIPVHRRQDQPGMVADNRSMFAAVQQALLRGDAVGLFPEGISHSAPALAELRTGAARIALAAAAERGAPIPIVPLGLGFRARDRFRSAAWVVRGEPIPWQDLAGADPADPAAVRRLTERIAVALEGQTVSLAAWHDQPVVETAVRIWDAECDPSVERGVAARLARQRETARVLARLRQADDEAALRLVDQVAEHGVRLTRLGLRPTDLGGERGRGHGLVGTLVRLPLALSLGALLAGFGWLAFLIPYRLTGWLVGRFQLETETRSTWQALIGAVIYLVWILAAALAVGWWLDWRWALATVLLLPLIGMIGLRLREQWRGAWRDMRRVLLITSRRDLVRALAARQRDLAVELERLYRHYSTQETA